MKKLRRGTKDMTYTSRIDRVGFLVFALLIFCAAPGWSQGYERRVEMSWDFTTAATPLGWSQYGSPEDGNPPLNGGLSFNGALIWPAGEETQILWGPWISVPTAPLQLVEVVMASDAAVNGVFTWGSDESGSWGRGTEFNILGDGAFHRYYLPIYTSSFTTIYRLWMLIYPPWHTASIKSIALVTMVPSTASAVSPLWQFDSDGDFKGWAPYSGVLDMSVSGGLLRIETYANTTLLAPPAQVNYQTEWFSLFGSVTSTLESPFLLFNYVSDATNSAETNVYVPLVPDAEDHVYNQNVGGSGGWWGTVSQMSITISENTTLAIERIQISDAPQGPADVFVDALGAATSLVRAGIPFQVSCRVSDSGAQPVEQLSVKLTLPDDGSIRVVSSPTVPTTLQNGYPQTLVWTLVSSRAGNVPISVTASAPAGSTSRASANILVNPSITPTKASYVPPPRPVSSKYDIGAYYFPGWSLDSHWDPIRNFPEHMPVQGYYAEGAPQVMDWQIKQAVDHGIKFFAIGPENPFFKAYFASKYKS